MSEHAKLSPSSSERWFHCPGSLVLSEGMESRSSSFAEEGTEAHKLSELMLKGLPSVASSVEMRKQVSVYVGHVRELALAPGSVLLIEKEVKVTDDCWGTADAIVWDPGAMTLYVRDLKYGAGVGVEVTDNLQLKIYALAALLTMGYPAQIVNVGIVQPRFPHPDGPVRSKDYDAVDLMDFHSDLMDAMGRVKAAAANGDLYLKHRATSAEAASEWETKYLKPSEKGCRWCLAAPTCPKVKAESQEMAKQVFAVATVDNGGVKTYDPAELARTLDYLPIMEGWIKNVREFAYAEAEKGHAIPDYKLVEKRATRKWKDEELGSIFLLGHDVDPWEKKIISPAAAEKLLPKDERALLADLTVKESSGHTLVHASDKREAVSIDAKSAFAEVDPFA